MAAQSNNPNLWDDPDSPDRPYLTDLGLRRWLNVGEEWVTKNTQARRIPGQKKMGRSWRYERAAIELQLAKTGKALLDPEKPQKVGR